MLGLKIIRASEMGSQITICCIRCGTWAPFHHVIRRLIVKSRKDLKPWDLYLELYHRSQTWQVPRQKCCRCACQISKWCDKSISRFRDFSRYYDKTSYRILKRDPGGCCDKEYHPKPILNQNFTKSRLPGNSSYSTSVMDIMNIRNFARFEFKIYFLGCLISLGQQPSDTNW